MHVLINVIKIKYMIGMILIFALNAVIIGSMWLIISALVDVRRESLTIDILIKKATASPCTKSLTISKKIIKL